MELEEVGYFTSWSISNTITVVIFFAAFILAYSSSRKLNGIPPGPSLTLPIVGDIPILLRGNVLQTFRNLRKAYGDIFSFYLGNELIIVFNGHQTIRIAAAKNLFSGRPHNFLTNVVSKGRGILLASGPLWKSQRLFIHNFLKSHQLECGSFENIILSEANYLVNALRDGNGTSRDPSDVIYASFANINLSMVVGSRRNYDDAVFTKLRKILAEATRLHLRISVLLNCVPFFKYLPFDLLRLEKIRGWTEFIGCFANELYKEHVPLHENCRLNGLCPKRDFMDTFICEMHRRSGTNGSGTHGCSSFNLDQLKVLVGELLGAASESPTTFLRWAILYLIHFPTINLRLRRDIETVFGKRTPRYEDMSRLPYVEAFISEVLRISKSSISQCPMHVSETMM